MEQIDNRFKVGDKVVVTKKPPNVNYYRVGDVLTIREVDTNEYSRMRYYAEFVNKPGLILWMYNEDIEAYQPEMTKIVITRSGKEVKARLIEGKSVLREATAKCSDKDTFDFETGAKLAFKRLYAKADPEKTEPKIGKNYIAKSDCLNGFGTPVLKKGDIVTVTEITDNQVYFNGFSRVMKQFIDKINIPLEEHFSEIFEEYAG